MCTHIYSEVVYCCFSQYIFVFCVLQKISMVKRSDGLKMPNILYKNGYKMLRTVFVGLLCV